MPLYYMDSQGNAVITTAELHGNGMYATDGGGGNGSSEQLYVAFIDGALGGETFLDKPPSAPPIPDDETTEVYIDGRKVRRDRVFKVADSGSRIEFAALLPDQDVELRYYGPA